MVRSCIPSFPDLSFLFYSKTTPPHLSPLKPRTCDLTATLHTSWQPSTCPQKCAGLCSHPPPGVETRVNGQLVSAAVPKKVLTPIAEGIDGRENVDIAAQAIKDADKVDEGSAGGSGAGLLTVSATAVSEVNNVDGERTPDLTSLLSDDGSEPANLNAEHLIKKRSGFADQLTADWLATLPPLPDSDLEPDDNASVLALYDVEFDDDEGLGTQAKHDQSPTHVHLLTSGSTTSALSLPFNAIDEAVYTDVNLDGEVDRLDPQPADERYLRPLSVPAGKDIDVWCEIAASPTVVKDVTKTLVANPDGKGMEGKKERPLSHVFFFENWKSSMQP